jgi:peroxiredoxin
LRFGQRYRERAATFRASLFAGATIMFHAFRVFAFTCLATLATRACADDHASATGPPASTSDLPRYRLSVGQQLRYETTSTQNNEGNERQWSTDWRFWVVANNKDGSWRIVVSKTKWRIIAGRDASADAKRAQPEVRCFDLYPDGRIGHSRLGFEIDARDVFTRLPDDVRQLAAGWIGDGSIDDEHHCQVESSEQGELRIGDERTNAIFDVNSIDWRNTYRFDRRRGLVDRIESRFSRKIGVRVEGASETKLVSTEIADGESTAALATEAQPYFDAVARYENAIERAGKDADQSGRICEDAKDTFGAAASKLTAPLFKAHAESLLARHDDLAKDALESAERRAKLIGTQAEPFETTDLDGQPRSLGDYRGKVVLLDFWYRGCGWCIRAMPQINEVARSFKDRPVAVIGMNIDQQLDDAKFVVEKMGLDYTNVKAEGLPEKFHVQAFPTMIVIDQKGIVREMHVGYSPTLAAELTDTIDALLRAE